MKLKLLLPAIFSLILLTISCKQSEKQALKPVDIKAQLNVSMVKQSPKQPIGAQQPFMQANPNMQSATPDTSECDIVSQYQLPLPYQLLNPEILGTPYFNQLYPIDSSDRWITVTQKSFFFGVYLSDLVYIMTYQRPSLLTKYYATVLKLSADLGIKQTFTSQYLKMFQQNYKSDTVQIIINDAIRKTCKFLYQTNQISILPFMLVGSWSESMVLLTGNAIHSQNVSMDVYKIIAQQPQVIDKFKYYIDNVMLDVESFRLSAQLQDLKAQLDSIKQVYQTVYLTDNISIDSQSLQKLQNAFNQLKTFFAKKQ